eukprot:5091511-Prymnesium_polylepis.1
MLCTDAPTIGSGWGLQLYMGCFFTAVGGCLRTLACDPSIMYSTTARKGLSPTFGAKVLSQH